MDRNESHDFTVVTRAVLLLVRRWPLLLLIRCWWWFVPLVTPWWIIVVPKRWCSYTSNTTWIIRFRCCRPSMVYNCTTTSICCWQLRQQKNEIKIFGCCGRKIVLWHGNLQQRIIDRLSDVRQCRWMELRSGGTIDSNTMLWLHRNRDIDLACKAVLNLT